MPGFGSKAEAASPIVTLLNLLHTAPSMLPI